MNLPPEDRFVEMLGKATLDRWSELPQDIQRLLFEHAVGEAGPALRDALAVHLHDRHPRTQDAV